MANTNKCLSKKNRIIGIISTFVFVFSIVVAPFEIYKADDATVVQEEQTFIYDYTWSSYKHVINSQYSTATSSQKVSAYQGTSSKTFEKVYEFDTYTELAAGSYRLVLTYVSPKGGYVRDDNLKNYGTGSAKALPYFSIGNENFYLDGSGSAIFEFDFEGGYIYFNFGADVVVTATMPTSSSRTGTAAIASLTLNEVSFALYKVDDSGSLYGDTDFYEPFYIDTIMDTGSTSGSCSISAMADMEYKDICIGNYKVLNLEKGGFRVLFQVGDIPDISLTLSSSCSWYPSSYYSCFSIGDDSFRLNSYTDGEYIAICDINTSGGYLPFVYELHKTGYFINESSEVGTCDYSVTVPTNKVYLYALSDGNKVTDDDLIESPDSGTEDSGSEDSGTEDSGSGGIYEPSTDNPFKEESDSQSSALDDANNSIGSLNKPDTGTLPDGSSDIFIDSDDVDNFSTVLKIVTNNSVVSAYLLVLFSTAMVGYVLFGKK